jgi:hypothetical protein
MRAIFTALTVLTLGACGGNNGGDDDGDDGPGKDACVGLECQVVNCQDMGKPTTNIVGTVFAPNGTLPLYGVNVYIPRDTQPLPAFTDGAACSRCSEELPGGPVAKVQSDDQGNFRLENVPAGDNIPLIITTGKWRRQIVIPKVEACTDTTLTAADTRLPKNKAEGDIPKIALTTGGADSLECLVRRLGIADPEVTTDTGQGRVHFFAGTGGVSSFSGGGNFTNAQSLWGSVDKLKQYDIVFLSCEGAQNANTKPQASLDAMKAYADLGGRVFASHWHNIWIGGNFTGGGAGNPKPAVWDTIAQWRSNDGNPGNPILIDEASNPKGNAFSNWMVNVKGSGPQAQTGVAPDTARGQISLKNGTGRATSTMLDLARAERWVYTNANTPQMFQFTTPNEKDIAERCGKVVFTDMHVSGDPGTGGYPNACPLTPLTPQEKALAFMFFDIASCVGPIF